VRAVAVSAERGALLDNVASHSVPLLMRTLSAPVEPGQPLLLNINFPKGEPKGVLATKLGRRDYHDVVEVRTDPRGRSYYWVGGPVVSHDGTPGADTTAIDDGYVAVTPLSLEMTFPAHLPMAELVAGKEQP
jgi:5'-nucleotidase